MSVNQSRASSPFLVLRLTIAAVAAAARVAEAGPIPAQQMLQRVPITNASATCNDGSRATIFFRNCSANWDSKGFDYCANITDTWVLLFAQDDAFAADPPPSGLFCYSPESCAARSAALTSSSGQPATAFLDGVLSPYAEENPNLYKQHSVVVPSCTSDLFAGAGGSFAGRAVLEAALSQLFEPAPPGEGPAMAHADRVVLVGGAGVLAFVDELAERLLVLKQQFSRNATARLDVFAVCDGCLLLGGLAPFAGPPACASDADCPADVALPRLQALLTAAGGSLARPRWCAEADVSACFLAPALGPALARARTPVLVQQMQYDAAQLLSLGVDVARAPAPARAYAESVFAPAARAAARAVSNYSFSAACAAPRALSARPAFYSLDVRFRDRYKNVLNRSMAAALPSFLEDAGAGGFGPVAFGSYLDTCTGFLCGSHCV
jgi:hypothetical protein